MTHLLILQALYGFMVVITCDGEVFYASRTVEQYLGFHQVGVV
jgi:aryl hydrocarbon receptor